MLTVDQYARRKLALINQREGTTHGEDYLEILREEVAYQYMYSDFTFDLVRKEESKTLTLLLTFADGDTVHTRFNGSWSAAIRHYSQNNLLTVDPAARIHTMQDTAQGTLYTFPTLTDCDGHCEECEKPGLCPQRRH